MMLIISQQKCSPYCTLTFILIRTHVMCCPTCAVVSHLVMFFFFQHLVSAPQKSVDLDLAGIQTFQQGLERGATGEWDLSSFQVLGEFTKKLHQHHCVFDHFDPRTLGPYESVFLLHALHHIHPPGLIGQRRGRKPWGWCDHRLQGHPSAFSHD